MNLSIAARTAYIYLAIGVCWILFSDSIVNRFFAPGDSAVFQLCKGLFYVSATALAGYLMLRYAIHKMEQSEARYRSIFENSGDALILLDPDGRILDANSVACEWYGYERKELLNLNFAALAGCEKCDGACNCSLLLAHAGEQIEATHCKSGGHQFPVEVLATPIEDDGQNRVLVNIRDISVRLRAEQELRASEARYRTYVDNAPLGIMIADRHGICKEVNNAACEILGYPAEELEGMNIVLLYDEPGLFTRESVDEFFHVGSLRVERKVKRKNDEVLDALIDAVVLDQNTALAFFIDVTEQRRLQQQLQRAAKMEAVGRLAGGVAHDLNNLLQVIQGHADLLRSQIGSTPALAPDLENIIDACTRAASLVRQLLAFSRKQVISPTHIDVNHVISEMLKLIGRTIGEHIEVRFQPGEDLGTTYADVGQLEQVIMNLCVNARDAMPDGGELDIETLRVHLDEHGASIHPDARPVEYIIIRVRDTGVGMDEETRAHIFEPFYTTKSFGIGTGLGLATVYGIVVQHGGFITVTSAAGHGSCFKVYLPTSEATILPKPTAKLPQTTGGHETILLAEDDAGVRMLTSRILTAAGYSILEAADGREALRIAEQHLDALDMALLDVVMPQLGGKAVHDALKNLRPDIPVLFMSGYTSGAVDTNSILHPGTELLAKPFDRATLLSRVRSVIDTANKPAANTPA